MGVDANPYYLTLLKYVVKFLFSIDRIEMVQNEVERLHWEFDYRVREKQYN